jgi:hypothetical protein
MGNNKKLGQQQQITVNFIKILPKFIVKTGLSDYLIYGIN